MLNRTLKILGIVVLLLVILLLSGVLEIEGYRAVDGEMFNLLWKNPSALHNVALDNKEHIVTHYAIDLR